MSPEPDDVREDDWEEEPDDTPRSIFAAGWFRAVLVLTVLAIVVVVALPYLLNWFDPAPTRAKAVSPIPLQATPPSAVGPVASPPVQAAPKAPPPIAPRAGASLPPDPTRTTPAPVPAMPSLPPPTVSAGPATSRPAMAALPRPEGARDQSASGYWVQLGLFKDPKNAEALAEKLRDQGFAVQVARVTRNETGAGASVPPGAYHLVRAGGFRDEARAVAARNALHQKGYTAAFLTQGAAR